MFLHSDVNLTLSTPVTYCAQIQHKTLNYIIRLWKQELNDDLFNEVIIFSIVKFLSFQQFIKKPFQVSNDILS